MITTEAVPKINMTEIGKKAKALGIHPGKMKKAELIHSIQIAEGRTPCFGKSGGQCPHTNCCFIQDCLKTSLTEYREAEENLQQQSIELSDANQQLQGEITKCKQAEESIKQQSAELSLSNKQLENQITEDGQAENKLEENCDRLEYRIMEQTDELIEANKQLNGQITEHKRVQKELQEYRDRLEQNLREQTDELAAINEQLQCEIAKRKHAKQNLALLQSKLDNTNFLIHKYLELKKIRPRRPGQSNFGLKCVARFCGRVLGLLANVFSR